MPDLATAGGDPEEQQTAGRPLEQDGGRVEASRTRPDQTDDDEVVVGSVERIGAVVGGDHDVLEAQAEGAGT